MLTLLQLYINRQIPINPGYLKKQRGRVVDTAPPVKYCRNYSTTQIDTRFMAGVL